MGTLRAFLLDESGANAIEYGLIAAGISLGARLKSTFSILTSDLQQAGK
jgi:Flp pilus assembly pilin Flp